MKILERISNFWPSGSGVGRAPTDIHEYSRRFCATVEREFTPLGFLQIKPRKFVRSTDAPIRQVVEIRAMKGMSDVLTWGLSFDFAPATDNQFTTMKWCRTEKTAQPMLQFDPLDHIPSEKHLADWLVTAINRAGRNQQIAAHSITRAKDWFSRVNRLETAIGEFEAWRDMRVVRFGYKNHIHAPLAHAFCLAVSGRAIEAEEAFVLWRTLHRSIEPELESRLKALLSQAHTFPVTLSPKA